MHPSKLRIGEEYAWRRWPGSSIRQGTLLSLEPLTIRYQEPHEPFDFLEEQTLSRCLVCQWEDKEEWQKEMLRRWEARQLKANERGKLEAERRDHLVERLLMAGYKQGDKAGFRLLSEPGKGLSLSLDMLERLLATHPEFADSTGESALQDLLSPED